MSAVGKLSLEIHYAIKTFRHCCTALSLIFGVPALVVVILCAHRASARYSAQIAFIVALGIVTDIIIQLVFDPLMLLPSQCILRENPLFPLPGGPNIYYAVQGPGSRWLISVPLRHFLVFLLSLGVFGVSGSLKLAEMSPDAEHMLLQALSHRWPTLAVARAKCYARFPFIVFALASICGLVLCAVLAVVITWHTFALLRKTSTLSNVLKNANVTMIKRLIVQASFPFCLIAFPLMFALIAVIAGFGGPLPYSICYLFISAHSPTHSIVLFVVTPLYRRKFVELFKRVSRNAVKDSTLKESFHSSRKGLDVDIR